MAMAETGDFKSRISGEDASAIYDKMAQDCADFVTYKVSNCSYECAITLCLVQHCYLRRSSSATFPWMMPTSAVSQEPSAPGYAGLL
jgi:hypothetical protein